MVKNSSARDGGPVRALPAEGEPPTAPRRRQEAKALFRDAILASAESLFAARSFHASRMQDIAAHARIAVGTLYNHFDDKEDILHAILEERTRELVHGISAGFESTVDDDRPFERVLADVVGRVLAFVEGHPAFYVVATECGFVGAPSVGARTALGDRPVRMRERVRATFRRLFDRGIARGAISGDPAELATFFGATLRAFTMDGVVPTKAPKDLESRAEKIAALFLFGATGEKRRAS